MEIENKPNPGSDEAIKMGCICPVLDNECGEGYLGQKDTFIIWENCPIHGKEKEPQSNELSVKSL